MYGCKGSVYYINALKSKKICSLISFMKKFLDYRVIGVMKNINNDFGKVKTKKNGLTKFHFNFLSFQSISIN